MSAPVQRGDEEGVELRTQPPPPTYQPRSTNTTPLADSAPASQHQHGRLPVEDGWENDEVLRGYRLNSVDDTQPPPAYAYKPPPYVPKKTTRGDDLVACLSPIFGPCLAALSAFSKAHKPLVACIIFLLIAVAVVIPCVLFFKVYKDTAQPTADSVWLLGTGASYQIQFKDEYYWSFLYSDTLTSGYADRKAFHLDSFQPTLHMQDTAPNFQEFAKFYAWQKDVSTSGDEDYSLYDSIYVRETETNDELVRFFRRLIEENEVQVGMSGKTKMKMKGRPKYTIEWDKNLTFSGFGGLSSLEPAGVTFYNLSDPRIDNRAYDFRALGRLATVNTPPASSISYYASATESSAALQLGRLAIDVFAESGEYLGYGNLTVDQLPDAGSSDTEVLIRLNGTTIEELEQTVQEGGNSTVPWTMRITGVYASGDYGNDEFHNRWLSAAIQGTELLMMVNVTEAAKEMESWGSYYG